MNGKLRIELDGKEIKLWFNKFSDSEMRSLFEIDKLILDHFGVNNLPKDRSKLKDIILQDKIILSEIEKRLKKNELVFISDLIWCGIVGQREALLEDTQMSRKEIRLAVAEISDEDLANVSSVFFKAMGASLEKSKKKAEKKAKKQSRSKAS